MMKYIFCILLGIFLSWGFQLISDERQEAYRPETGSTYIQTCVNAFHPETKTMIKQLGKEKKLVKAKENTGKQDYNDSDGVLNPSSFRYFSPSKLLRFNIHSVTIRILSSLKIQLPKNQWTGFSFYTNFIKYSDRYHIYTLGFIPFIGIENSYFLCLICCSYLFLLITIKVYKMDFLLNFILHIDQYMAMIVRDYHAWTYAILFIIIFCETGLVVTPFLPGDSLLFVAGAISALPDMPISIHILVIILFAAAILGDSCNYMIGHFFGRRLFNNPKSKIFKQSHLEKTHEFYKKYGGKTIILARFIPIVRTFAPFVAGMGKMNYYYFMVYNLVGGAVWVTIFCYAGYFFGDLPFVQENLKLLIVAIIFISILPAVIEVIRAKLKF